MRRSIVILLAGVILAGCSGDGPVLVIDDVVVTPPLPGSGMSAGYFRLTNTGDEPVVIDRVRSPDYVSVEMHETRVEDGVARMRPLDVLRIEPGESLEFSRGGRHLMMQGPGDPGERVTLEFWSGETLLLSVSTMTGG